MSEDVAWSILAVCTNNPAVTALLTGLLAVVATLSLVVMRLWRTTKQLWSTFVDLQDRVLTTFGKVAESNAVVAERMQAMVRELDHLNN